MAQDIQKANFTLPWYTSYNSTDIPFIYPPLALYLMAVINRLFSIDLLFILRFLPCLFNLLTAFAVYRLSRVIGFSKPIATISFAGFLLLPEGFRWLIMGGGITRAPGLLFAVLAITQLFKLFQRSSQKDTIISAIFCSAVILTHLEMAWFTFYTAILLIFFYGRSWKSTKQAVLVAIFTLGITSPWWGTVFYRFGLSPIFTSITGSSQEWPWFIGVVTEVFSPTNEFLFPILGTLIFIGTLYQITDKDPFLPVWAFAVFILQSRGPLAKATIPLSILIGIAVIQVILPIYQRKPRYSFGVFGSTFILIASLLICILSAVAGERSLVSSLTDDERDAMVWFTDHTPESSKVLLVESDSWVVHRLSEWFPALTRRTSVATVQGHEFLPNNQFAQRIEQSKALRDCVLEGSIACIDGWAAEYSVDFSYLYIPKTPSIEKGDPFTPDDCCDRLRTAMDTAVEYQKVFENNDAAIYAHKP
ncbi:MAG TPA: glycosyltransferase family 39 protein [Anaerolineaceae bacterium]|nr:glycosyltransferase family 39 protein [Anaerolineaceae bacterium]